MSEPRVEFDLNNIEDPQVREQFDQFRRWYEFREDRNTPAMQTFEGTLSDGEEVRLYVPGEVYGYSGMTTFASLNVWMPMLFNRTDLGNQCFFSLDTDNSEGDFVTVKCATGGPKRYRATVMYIGNSDGN